MHKKSDVDVVVIGGGAAGMIAAGRAAERGRRVLLLEKNPSLGKKLLITGGGRCNVTNNKPEVRTMLARYKKSDKFLFSAFTQFGVAKTLDFFHTRGMATHEEAEGRVFPASNKSQSVYDVLVKYMEEGNVKIQTKAKVAGIAFDKSSEEIVITLADKSEIRTQSCIVASGGISRPETGSTGDGFSWLQKLGHTVVPNDMALVPIALKDAWIKKCAGVALSAVKLTTFQKGKKQKVYLGKMLFTHVGISGPMVLNMSRDIGVLLEYEEDVMIMLDIFPSLDIGSLREKLQTILISDSNKKIKNVLSLIIQPALVLPLLALAGIDGETPSHSMRSLERKALTSLLKEVPLHILGLLGKDKAIISSGGVELSQIDFKTMQSRVIPRLYIVGDMLNIDRPSGGYSLQLCWTTGYIAGSNC